VDVSVRIRFAFRCMPDVAWVLRRAVGDDRLPAPRRRLLAWPDYRRLLVCREDEALARTYPLGPEALATFTWFGASNFVFRMGDGSCTSLGTARTDYDGVIPLGTRPQPIGLRVADAVHELAHYAFVPIFCARLARIRGATPFVTWSQELGCDIVDREFFVF